MKKFYEIPVVEITVFDVEDVITASVASTAGIAGEELKTFVDGVQATYGDASKNASVTVGAYNSYNW